jgi:hypothetical protein
VRALNRFMAATTPPDNLAAGDANVIEALFRYEFRDLREPWLPTFEALARGEEVNIVTTKVWPFNPTAASLRRQRPK